MKHLKKINIIVLISIILISCTHKETFNYTFDKVVIYDYGRSFIGLTYEIPIKFYFKDKEISSFYLFSFDKYLESGVYNYTDSIVGTHHAFPKSRYSNKTFFKDKCKWWDNYITSGTVTVDRQNDNYTFIIDVLDVNGEQHYGKFSGKVEKKDWHTKSEIGGIFCSVGFWEGYIQPTDENYVGTMMQLDAGDIYNYLHVNLGFLLHKNSDITGIYHINPNANGYIQSAVDGVYSNFCKYRDYPVEEDSKYGVESWLESGTITIKRVNEKWQYRIDVDVIAKNGYKIKGCFNGGEIDLFGDIISW